MGVGIMNAMAGVGSEYGETVVADRSRPRAHSREAIERVVFEEVARVSSTATIRTLVPESSLAGCGIDTARFLDVITRIEGRYQMRFRDEWLEGIRTCADLVDCIAIRMFDEADRAGEVAERMSRTAGPQPAVQRNPRRTASVTATRVLPAADSFAFPECVALEERLAGLEGSKIRSFGPTKRCGVAHRGSAAARSSASRASTTSVWPVIPM
jgi:acyl carrier protein